MRLRLLTIIALLASFSITSAAQDSLLQNKWVDSREYSFILMDTPSQLFTMRQVDESYLSFSRLFSRSLYEMLDNDYYAELIQVAALSLFLMPLTHEEGHRSILTGENIGSISDPYFNKEGAAYVKGVNDETLEKMRDESFPEYIRLHAGGLESDYMLTKRIDRIGSFEMDDFQTMRCSALSYFSG